MADGKSSVKTPPRQKSLLASLMSNETTRSIVFSFSAARPCGSSCVPAACQLLCLLQQPAQCWNVPIQAVYSHSVTCSSCSLGQRSSHGGPLGVRCFFLLCTNNEERRNFLVLLSAMFTCVALCLMLLGK